jgi:hypothetical protein
VETDRIAALIRTLRTTPTRRAVATGVVTLAVSTPLAPLFGLERAEAKRKGRKKNNKRKKKNNCTDCGCCPPTQPSCCGDGTSGNRFCYSTAAETCCPTTVAGIAGACPKGTVCALGPGGGPLSVVLPAAWGATTRGAVHRGPFAATAGHAATTLPAIPAC